MTYWDNVAELKAKASSHTIKMAQLRSREIQKSIDEAVVYPADRYLDAGGKLENTTISFVGLDSVAMLEAAKRVYKGRFCILDFADYMHPGGKFLEGSSAQEESLCHQSFLYNVLKSDSVREKFYNAHKGRSNKCLYSDELLYVPDVIFLGEHVSDVIVCAAPNKNAAMRYNGVSSCEVDHAMAGRCSAVLRAANYRGVDILILGAFGCGVFGNDPKLVARTFRGLLDGPFKSCFKAVIFAVPGVGRNVDAFRDLFD